MRGTERADRRNGSEPEPDLLDDLTPPAEMSERSAAVWRQVAPLLRAMKVLTVADVFALEQLCDDIADYRLARSKVGEDFVKVSAKGSPMLNQWLVARHMCAKRAEVLMGKFGMDPRSRSQLMIDPQGDLFGKPDPNGPGRFFQQTH